MTGLKTLGMAEDVWLEIEQTLELNTTPVLDIS